MQELVLEEVGIAVSGLKEVEAEELLTTMVDATALAEIIVSGEVVIVVKLENIVDGDDKLDPNELALVALPTRLALVV